MGLLLQEGLAMRTNSQLIKPRTLAYALGASAQLAASYFVVRNKTRQVEREHPPQGDFITVDGVRLHYLSQGEGPAVVLLHGNGATAEDFRNAGLFDQLAREHRVIAFDRPGYGYSERPRNTVWTPAAQAKLLAAALAQLGVERAVVLAHSWGTMVALALARQQPALVSGMVLASGYYYPSVRLDVLTGTPAIPVLGDLMRYTISPLVGRLIWPLMIRRAFHPNAVADSFRRYPKWMSLRPGQLRAEAAETAMMIPSAAALKKHYPELRMPVEIIGGEKDKVAATGHNSVRLHDDIAHSELTVLPGAGHMVQHGSQQELVRAVERVARAIAPEAGHGDGRLEEAAAAWQARQREPAGARTPL
jgi:pimeloyl-ACP methyl ester carboxylesterase